MTELDILIAIGVPRQEEAGAASVALNHARELERRGHHVDCWFLEDVLAKPIRRKRLEALLFARGVAKRILGGQKKFDVVNLHAPWGCVYGIRRKFVNSGDAPPYVMTMQGSEKRYVEAMRLENRKGRAANFGWKNRFWHRLYHQTMYDLSIRTADYGAIACEEGRVDAARMRNGKPGNMRFVPNGTEERFFLTREYGANSSPRLLYVGTWLERKGVYYLVEGFRLLAARVPKARLTVAGCFGTGEQVEKSFAMIREKVRVVPFVKRGDMPALYAEHDIFIFPSLVEGMPLTLLEAMATGMPVVTTNVCGMADVVEDGANGLLVPPADAEALAEAVARLCASAELRMRLGQAAQQTMRKYTWSCVTQDLESILRLAWQGEGPAI